MYRIHAAPATAVIALVALVVGLGSISAALASDVSGHTTYGVLVLTGSPQNDEIVIVRLPNNTIRVSGRNGTTVGGSPFADFYSYNNSLHSLDINLQDGDDRVVIGDLQNVTQMPGYVTIDLGNGDDTADLQMVDVGGNGGNTTIMAGDGYDYVSISYSHLRQDLLLDLGPGDAGDHALIQSTQIDGSAIIHADAVSPQGSPDQDIIELYDVTIDGDLQVWTGGGVDGVNLTGITVSGTVMLDTGDHRDHVAGEKIHAGALEVSLGNGDDLMELWYSMIGTASLNGGEGEDTLCRFDSTIEELSTASFEATCR